MANNIYGFIALTGGTSGALDEIDGSELTDKDMAFGCVDGDFCAYQYDADSVLDESVPDVIAPDSGSGRWIKQESGGGGSAGDFLVAQIFS